MLTLQSNEKFSQLKRAYLDKDELVIGTTGIGYMVTDITNGEILLATWKADSYRLSDCKNGAEKIEQLMKLAYRKAVRIDEDMHVQIGELNDGCLSLCGLRVSR